MNTKSQSIRVLVVDDDAAVRDSLCAYLVDEGFVVRCAGTVGQALAELAAGGIDVAVTDLRLPEGDGPTLIARAHELAPAVKFLIYTGSVNYRLPDSLAAIGMAQADVVTKPARSLGELAGMIGRLAAAAAEESHRATD